MNLRGKLSILVCKSPAFPSQLTIYSPIGFVEIVAAGSEVASAPRANLCVNSRIKKIDTSPEG
jgi:hypothetical protein